MTHPDKTLYLPHAYGQPVVSGVIRFVPEDFTVEETLSFELTGQGEHVYLNIEKRDCNTSQLASQIARLAKVRNVDIGYAGLKDKRAVTRQWFSIYLPKGDEPDWQVLENANVSLLQHTRHQAKLRRGAISGNYFSLVVRQLEGDVSTLAERLEKIKMHGVPNYFTEQRFGKELGNIQLARELLSGKLKIRDRQKKGLLYSAARSYLFNQILAVRVQHQTWNKALDGDVMMLGGSKRFFTTVNEASDLQTRVDTFDIHPSGVLWGKGEQDSVLQACELEMHVIDANAEFKQGLLKAGIKRARRSLRLMPRDMCWQLDEVEAVLKLEFSLESGGYATAILHELLDYSSEYKQA